MTTSYFLQGKRFMLKCLTWKLGVTCEKLKLVGLIQRASSVLLFLPPHQLFFPLFLQWLFICFHLLLALGIRRTFYLYAQMLWRYGLVGHLHISPCSRALHPSLPLFLHPFILCGGSSPFASWSLFLHVAINSPTSLVSTLNVVCT